MKGVLRRTRLPLVVSLFLAALLGAPTAAGPVLDPLPVPATAAAAATQAAPATAPAVPEEIVAQPPIAPAAPAQPVSFAAPLLTDQVSTAAAAPRGPPATA
jgi:hypothetical protein